ncbi:class II aldolase/adducin family protein [Arthrobacter sp. SLBN-53]|uniref:class II aldolase/adducin family protein n=1 Tax=Arthrobacter sp. SLBN-53 TaxID=2768412 RepID=UPI00114E21EF|nr:class II aldolase/adducin family protein [Arthrobacter sp. SLBN-53]TQK29904.1 L-fuculose-phosphate aldolase [Arthrobacter sp. SLBN-53]
MSDHLNAENVARTARRLAAEGMLIGTAGNVSVRDDDHVFVTATGVTLADCSADDIVKVTLDGEIRSGRMVPTSELSLHLGVYARVHDVRAVVHTHAPFATALACVAGLDTLPVLHYQQLSLGGEVRVAPFAPFGSPQLAEFVDVALADRRAALMANHGSVTVGTDLEDAFDKAVLLEWLAGLYLHARSVGPVRPLTPQQQQDTIIQAINLQYGQTRENHS